MDRWLNVGVKGTAIWPKKEMTVSFGGHKLLLRPATKVTEQSVHIRLHRIADVDALTLINRFLSILSWCDDQSMENIYGWSGNPVPVSVPRQARGGGSSIAFPFNRDVPKDSKARLALALFREGRTANSVPFQFLSYFKILNIFWKDSYQKGVNPLVERIRDTLSKIKDSMAMQRVGKLEATKPDVARYLYESGRCAIAHAYSDPIVDPDDVADLRRLSEDMRVVKAIAEHLIEVELGVSRSIIGDL